MGAPAADVPKMILRPVSATSPCVPLMMNSQVQDDVERREVAIQVEGRFAVISLLILPMMALWHWGRCSQ